jgi:hypothetical protein
MTAEITTPQSKFICVRSGAPLLTPQGKIELAAKVNNSDRKARALMISGIYVSL